MLGRRQQQLPATTAFNTKENNVRAPATYVNVRLGHHYNTNCGRRWKILQKNNTKRIAGVSYSQHRKKSYKKFVFYVCQILMIVINNNIYIYFFKSKNILISGSYERRDDEDVLCSQGYFQIAQGELYHTLQKFDHFFFFHQRLSNQPSSFQAMSEDKSRRNKIL